MPRLKRPSIKQKKFVSGLLKTGNGTEAALAAYNTKDRKTAQVIAYQNMNKPEVMAEVDKALKKNNITLEGQTERLKEIAVDWMPDKISSDTVLKANIELLKLLKAYPDRVMKHESRSIKVNFNSKDYKDLLELNKEKQSEIADIIDTQ